MAVVRSNRYINEIFRISFQFMNHLKVENFAQFTDQLIWDLSYNSIKNFFFQTVEFLPYQSSMDTFGAGSFGSIS